MGLKIGNTDIIDVKIGSADINKVMRGSDLIWEKGGGSTYDPDVQSYMDRIDNDLGSYDMDAIDELNSYVLWLKANNLWDDIFNFVPSAGYKSGTLYSLVPNDGSADYIVSRNSVATRVDPNGLIETVSANTPRIDFSSGEARILIETESTNLMPYSETYDTYNQSEAVTLDPNATISPSGLENATKLIEDANDSRKRCGQAISTATGNTYTHSVYLKPNGRTWARLMYVATAAGNPYANFDLTNGVIGHINTSTTNTTATIEDVGNGWYRCTMTFTAIADIGTGVAVYMMESDYVGTTPKYQGDGVSGIFMWGNQFEQKSQASSYIPTNGQTITRQNEVIKTGILATATLWNNGISLYTKSILPTTTTTQIGLLTLGISGNVTGNIFTYYDYNNQRYRITIKGDEGSQGNSFNYAISSPYHLNYAETWEGSTRVHKACADGNAVSPRTFVTPRTTSTDSNFTISDLFKSKVYFYKGIAYNRVLTDNEMILLTT